MAKIGIWGDSIVYGEVDIVGSGWATRIRKHLSMQAEKNNTEWHQTYVRGVCGETSRDLLKRFAVEAESIRPDIVLLAVGINDAAYVGGMEDVLVPIEEFEENIRKLVTCAKKYTEKVILLGLTCVNEQLVQPYPYSSKHKSYANKIIERYDVVLRELASAEDLPIALMGDKLTESDLEDGLHPNSAGHQKIAEHLLFFIEKTLV